MLNRSEGYPLKKFSERIATNGIIDLVPKFNQGISDERKYVVQFIGNKLGFFRRQWTQPRHPSKVILEMKNPFVHFTVNVWLGLLSHVYKIDLEPIPKAAAFNGFLCSVMRRHRRRTSFTASLTLLAKLLNCVRSYVQLGVRDCALDHTNTSMACLIVDLSQSVKNNINWQTWRS